MLERLLASFPPYHAHADIVFFLLIFTDYKFEIRLVFWSPSELLGVDLGFSPQIFVKVEGLVDGGCVRLDDDAVAPVGLNCRVFACMQLTCSFRCKLAGDSPLERLSVWVGRSVPSQVTRSIPRSHDG